MKKLLLLLFIVFAIFVVWNRQRLFLRNPLAAVTRDGIKEDGAQVFINYDNDVMVENDRAPMYVEVVQHGDHTGAPVHMKCVHYLVCLMDAGLPTLAPWPSGIKVESMSNKVVTFREGKRETVVTLR